MVGPVFFMRTLAIILNLALLAAVGYMLVVEEVSLEGTAIPLFLLMIGAPIVNLVALALRGVASQDWLSRYFERKAIEERRRIEELRRPAPPAIAPPNDRPEEPPEKTEGSGGPRPR